MKIFLLKKYSNKSKGDIIDIDDDTATILVEEGIGRFVTNRDFLVRIEMGISKAFKFSPKRK